MYGGINLCEFSPEEIKDIEYIDSERLLGRHVVSLPYKDSNENWIMWIPANGKLEKVFAEPAEIEYIAAYPDKDTDVFLFFYNFLIKHLAYPEGINTMLVDSLQRNWNIFL